MRVVADDLSGAVETAAVLGFERVRLTGDAEGAVLDLDTRTLPPHEAAARVRRAGRIDFKKIDSQLRGNVAAELAVLKGTVIVAPALPVERRVVRGGVLYVDGEPRPSPVPLTDAETDADLDAIVAAADGATLVGSAGLAAALGRTLGARPLPAPQPSTARLWVLVGTRVAGEQLTRLAATGVEVLAPGDRPSGRVAAVRGRAQQLAAFAAAAPRADLVITGGGTARAVLDALGVRELRLIAQVHHGAVVCRARGRRILIRPGSFGGPDSLARIVEAMHA